MALAVPLNRATPTPASPTAVHMSQRLDLGDIHALISSVDRHVRHFLSDDDARAALQARCIARLAAVQRRGHFEFAEHSAVSNLYWGIENLEATVRTESEEERRARVVASERMLQIPAMLEEEGGTAGLPNRYLVCCSYFYLSLVRRLQGDEWQTAMHLLQAVIVSPFYVRTELALGLCGNLFVSRIAGGGCEDAVDEATGHLARRYKDWLMYYRVLSYGENPLGTEVRAIEDAATHTDPHGYM